MHEKLAQWMRREEATVSHLTPAMGQILVSFVRYSVAAFLFSFPLTAIFHELTIR